MVEWWRKTEWQVYTRWRWLVPNYLIHECAILQPNMVPLWKNEALFSVSFSPKSPLPTKHFFSEVIFALKASSFFLPPFWSLNDKHDHYCCSQLDQQNDETLPLHSPPRRQVWSDLFWVPLLAPSSCENGQNLATLNMKECGNLATPSLESVKVWLGWATENFKRWNKRHHCLLADAL